MRTISIINAKPPMTRVEAEEAVSRVKGHMTQIKLEIVELYEREAHKALGYATWNTFIYAEFGFSPTTANKYLKVARVLRAIKSHEDYQEDELLPPEKFGISHLVPLSDLPEEHCFDAYEAIKKAKMQAPVNEGMIKDYVEKWKKDAGQELLGVNKEYQIGTQFDRTVGKKIKDAHFLRKDVELTFVSGRKYKTYISAMFELRVDNQCMSFTATIPNSVYER